LARASKGAEEDLKPAVRFVDASVFVNAYLKPKRVLTPEEVQIKENAKMIVAKVNSGERVVISVVHLGEISNILEDYLPLDDALSIERALLFRENIEVAPVAIEDYVVSSDVAEKHRVGLNDALAYVLMKKNQIDESYSFDRDFDKFKDIKRLKS
jgi:predicted nucleic acid-binding protein